VRGPLTLEAADWLATERARLEDEGTIGSTEDGLIAATAHVNGLTLVTANTKHFARFQGLRAVNWMRT
jgi:tRNA(fMet)-specific endonuclease VapC